VKNKSTSTSPNEWVITTIKEISEVNPRLIKAGILDSLSVSFVPMPSVGAGDGSIDVSMGKTFGAVKKGFTAFQEGDVLFAKITPCMENGKMAIVPQVINGYGFGSTEFHVLRPKNRIIPEYLYYYISSKKFRGEAERYMTGAVGQKRVSTNYLKHCKIPIAPFEQQKRIVAEIEKQFSRLDQAVENLKRAKANLKRYKAAVLKAAVEGKLTEQWRKDHPDVEPADKLLKRILTERRKRWEETELAKMKAKDNVPKDDKWKTKYRTPDGPDTSKLPKLPEGWVWVRAEQVCDFITKGTTPHASKLFNGNGEIPFIKVYNLTFDGALDFTINPTFISLETHDGKLSRSRLYPGDVLMNIVGPPLGKVSILPELYPKWNMNQAVAVFRAMPSLDLKFLAYLLMSEEILNWAKSRAKATAGQFNLTLEICRDLPLPIPPKKEQERLAAEIEKILTNIDESSKTIEANLKRADRLRQSILKKAFSGQLIPSGQAYDSDTTNELPMAAEATDAYGVQR
jgi:type I restriction enzyme, S subunit